MRTKDERVIYVGLLGAAAGYLVNGTRGALALGLSGAALQTAREHPKESAEIFKMLLNSLKAERLADVEPIRQGEVETSADVELKSCGACGLFHRAFECPRQPARLLAKGKKGGRRR